MNLRGMLRRRRREEPVSYADDGSLVVVGGSDDPARADSEVVAALASSGVPLDRPLLVRHHLQLPEPALPEARALLAQDGYALAGEPPQVRASRTQLLTGLSVAQERSRMAGLAQRLGGDVAGWDVLAPPPGEP